MLQASCILSQCHIQREYAQGMYEVLIVMLYCACRDDRSRLRSRDREAEQPDRELERQRAAERKAADAHAAETERAYRDRLAKLEKRERWAASTVILILDLTLTPVKPVPTAARQRWGLYSQLWVG